MMGGQSIAASLITGSGDKSLPDDSIPKSSCFGVKTTKFNIINILILYYVN